MTFGEKLQLLRKKRHLSQEQLAAQITISRQAISKWEMNSSLPDIENVILLSDFFGVSIDYLLKDDTTNDYDKPKEAAPHNNLLRIIVGTVISVMGFAGGVILGILASVKPVYNTYMSGEQIIAKSGLFEYLKLHNLGWLFALCSLFILAGVVIALFPQIATVVNKVRKWWKSLPYLP